MANIFNLSNDQTPDVNRNTFDLSFQNNFTAKFGYLYPVFCKEVLPGDTFKIRPTFALEFMPMVFPVQTRMRANLHFFYCRNRAAYKDFQDWIGNTNPDADPPYIDMNANFDNMCKTGSLGDYMGLPTTLVGDYGTQLNLSIPANQTVEKQFVPCYWYKSGGEAGCPELGSVLRPYDSTVFPHPSVTNIRCASYVREYPILAAAAGQQLTQLALEFPEYIDILCSSDPRVSSDAGKIPSCFLSLVYLDSGENVLGTSACISPGHSVNVVENSDGTFSFRVSLLGFPFHTTVPTVPEGTVKIAYSISLSTDNTPRPPEDYEFFYKYYVGQSAHSSLSFVFGYGDVVNSGYSDLDAKTSPYYDSINNPTGIKVNALPFRHYEAIGNTFYRDSRNNPLMVNGKPVYNQVYLTTEGGVDSTPYTLRRRNWESDFLTTAVQSPQQGAAPLVGISSTGKMTFQDESGKQYQAQAEFAEDGETITGFKVLSDDMPQANLRSLIDMSTTGISIADLRQVNSLQRWLEANMRKGLRYRDQMKAHFGIDIAYKELNMPEFIGGCSEDVRVNMVTQTTPTGDPGSPDSQPLGSYAGQASCVGTSNHDVDQYCDEHGYIIGIFSVTPVPNYSQLLPKHFIKRNIMDYFFPEFGNLGFVPIKYDEVCPVQAHAAGDKLDSTFGYQRAWYDYLASVDEVHGEFRKSLRDYLMNRTFDVKPELSESFLLVDPEQLNEVFAVTSKNDDKIMGQIYFDCKVKRPIPLFGIPRLE